MRYIEIKDKKLIKAVERKYELVERANEYKKEMDAIRDKALELNKEIQDTKDEINELMIPLVEKENLGEFEEEGSTEIIDGKACFAVIDKLANAKKALKKDKENRDRRERGEFTPEELVDQKQQKFTELVQGVTQKGLKAEELDPLLDKLIKVIENV